MSPPSSESIVGLTGALSPPASPKMNSKTSNDDQEGPPSNNTNAPVPESEPNFSSEFPTPPQSHHSRDNHVDEDDYSDALSADSQQRRHPRGGRKPKQLKRPSQRLQSVSEFELPTSRSQTQPQEEEQDDFDAEDGEEAPTSPLLAPPETENHDDYDADALKKARGSRSKGTRKHQSRPPARNGSTGVSSMSIKRPRGGGRKPPIAVSVERPEKSKVKSKSKGEKEREREVEEDRSAEGSEEGESEEDEREEEEKRKPVQIRLDLNLELEILLKAKIKGDITITFLE